MKNRQRLLYRALVISILGLTAAGGIHAQAPYDVSYIKDPVNCSEKITLFTDRSMYAVNEQIHFRSYYSKGPELQGKSWSRVLYCELLASDGIVVAKGKYFLETKGASGILSIPQDVLTGNYFLRAYTRWMRNFGPRSYSYIPLKIINPFRQEIRGQETEAAPGSIRMSGMKKNIIFCRTDKNTYSPGETVSLELKLSNQDMPQAESYCLTVVPAGLADTLYAGVMPDLENPSDNFHFDFLPDLRGISLSGKVIKAEDQSPVADKNIHFAIIGEKPAYLGTISDKSGYFAITIPDNTGILEVFAAAEPSESVNYSILIDNDFSGVEALPGNLPFDLSPEEKKVATHMAINMQLSMAYKEGEAMATMDYNPEPGRPFYGKPVTSILMDDFISLPSMTEVFENLISGVQVERQQGKAYLSIESLNSNISLFPPLLLIDHIPVFDPQAFLSVAPGEIEKIEVVNEVFIRGNMIFGGIIAATSIKGDMAAIDLPEGASFFDYQAWHTGSGDLAPDQGQQGERVPDSRNTLLWMEDLVLHPDISKTIQFTTAPLPGEYHILVRAVSSRGETVSGLGRFYVR